MSRRFRLGLFLLVALALVVPASPAVAVAYGRWVDSPSRTVPWVLPLERSGDGFAPYSLKCSAVAIGPRLAMTSAQCVRSGGFYFLEVGTDRVGGGRHIAVEALLQHPKFRARTHRHDVAVLRPLRSLGLSSYARLGTARLTKRVASDDPPTLTLYGWGRNEDRSSTVRLRQGRVLPQDAVAARLYDFYRAGSMLAAGRPRPAVDGYVGACEGDEGGPLVVRKNGRPYVVGITSWSDDRCRRHRPTIFTSVSAHRTWLDDAIARLPGLAQSHNLARPENIVAPTITGTVAAGSTVTCDPGVWTSNATDISFRWEGLTSTESVPLPSSGNTYTFKSSDTGQLFCRIDATSAAGTTTNLAVVTVPGPPKGSGFPSITGLATASGTAPLPAPGTVVSCVPPLYTEPGVVVTTQWSVVDGTTVEVIGSGTSLVLSADLVGKIAGHTLKCTTSASIAGFTPDVRSASRLIAAVPA